MTNEKPATIERPLFLIGTRENQMDGKGRLTVPAPYRQTAPELWTRELYVVPGLDPVDHFLEVYVGPVWEARYRQVQALPHPVERQAMMRGFINRVAEVKVDAQGRFVLPAFLADWADLKDGAAVCWVGQDDHIELWSKARFDAGYERQREDAYRVWLANQERFGR